MKHKTPLIFGLVVGFAYLALSCASTERPAPTPPEIVRTVGQYQVTSCKSIVDTATGLEWFVGPDELQTSQTVKAWLDDLRKCDGPCCDKHWRLPESREIQTLNRPAVRNDQNVNVIDPQFRELAGGERWVLWDAAAQRRFAARSSLGVGVGVGVSQHSSGGAMGAMVFIPGSEGEARRPVAVRTR